MGVYQLRYGLAGLYRSYWKGNFHIMFTCLSNVLDILEIELKQKEVFLYVFFLEISDFINSQITLKKK
jgi:hypothetical protein